MSVPPLRSVPVLAKIERKPWVHKHAFDRTGRRVCVGSATLLREGEVDLEARVWCEAGDDAAAWWLLSADISNVSVFIVSPDRNEALLGTKNDLLRIDLRDGAIVRRGLSVEQEHAVWVKGPDGEDNLLVSVGDRLQRRTFDGALRPFWAERSGLTGLLDRPLERWLATTESMAASFVDIQQTELWNTPARPARIANAPRVLVGRDGDVHIVQGSSFKLRKGERSSWTVVWVRFDPSGNVVHRVAVPLEYATDEAALDAIGRLYVRGTVEDGRFAIVRINPTRKTAATVAESKTADRLDGFAIDPDGNLRLREKRVKGGGRELEVLSQRSVFGRWARGGLVAGVAAALASIPATLATKKELLTAAANGETITVSHGRGSRSRLGPSDLEALVPALDAQVVESIVFAVGLLVLLLTVGRGTPARAVALGAIWALAVLVISIPLHMVVGMGFARPFEVMAASMAAPGVLLGVGLGLLALGAGRRASFRP